MNAYPYANRDFLFLENLVQNNYIHIPFCRQKCPYCKFALTPIFDDVKKKRYLGYLKREIREYFASTSGYNQQVGTIYFGGGTPSVLSIQEVQDILEIFPRDEKTEISFECNPEDISSEYVSGIIELGINRLSIGVQSLNNETLKAIHRSDRESIFRALENIESSILSFRGTRNPFQDHFGEEDTENQLSAGKRDFSAPLRNDKKSFGILNLESGISVNIDFILGLPFSKPGETLENIRELHKRFPFISHTSIYMLEDGLYPKEWKKESIGEDEMEREYRDICEYFDSLGWHHYEISSWAKPGYECQHNMGYWDHTDTRGFGLSATNYIGGKRWTNSESFAGYYQGDIIDAEILTKEEKNLEKIIHDLRTFRLDEALFPGEILDTLESSGLIERKDRKIILTPAGIFRENTILSELAGVAQW